MQPGGWNQCVTFLSFLPYEGPDEEWCAANDEQGKHAGNGGADNDSHPP